MRTFTGLGGKTAMRSQTLLSLQMTSLGKGPPAASVDTSLRDPTQHTVSHRNPSQLPSTGNN
ncbi:hypothetical protein PAL_GLEAN10014621 [Pteropus alecto]|uniref:Uncharacterized protein n=1 Tax=Pteropus alecto TaxID=9402 RepID=L5KL62_PTEAL|nr:hypothetical protein PAL_GLEAN10014621 [Pteropus alecto]